MNVRVRAILPVFKYIRAMLECECTPECAATLSCPLFLAIPREVAQAVLTRRVAGVR